MTITDQKAADVGLNSVVETVESHYGADLGMAVKGGCAVVACHSLKERESCLSLLYVGASGKGKSVTVNTFMPDRAATRRLLHRVDSFTPASFVSHAANKKKGELATIDLLPKIKDTTMLTKELSPLFRGDFKEMQKNFAVLTSVLDGRGYITRSGAQGERGYTGEYLFNWIGATTPFSDIVYKLMAQLGNRIYFYEIVSVDLNEDDLIEFAKKANGDTGLKECQTVVNDFVESHFTRYPLKSVDPADIAIPENVILELVRYAQLISVGRVEVFDEFGGRRCGEAEGPHRIILSLKMLAMGAALADQRMHITAANDMALIRHVAFSTIPETRRNLLRALLLSGDSLTSTNAATALRISRPTALEWMEELAATGIVNLIRGDQRTSKPASIVLATDWTWLVDGRIAHCPAA